jgi:hypothetical protein
MTDSKSKHYLWQEEVRELRQLLDEDYKVALPGNFTRSSSRRNQVAWARIGVEKFCYRIIPQLRGAGPKTKAALPLISEAIYDAVAFGNSTLVVANDGSYRVSTPETGVAEVDAFGSVAFEENFAKNESTFGNEGSLYFSDNNWKSAPVGSFFSIFYRANFKHKYGQSRVTPAIRAMIKAESRTNMRMEEVEDNQSFPLRVINGLWENFDPQVMDAARSLVTGANQIIGLPKNPDSDQYLELEEFKGAEFDGFLKIKDQRARACAAAFNIDPIELGVTTTNPSSAEALYASKEDLVLEVAAFENRIHSTAQAFLSRVAELNGESEPVLYWAEPATPSKASQADAFVKLASVIPQLATSHAALAWAGLPGDLAVELAEEALKASKAAEVQDGSI